MAIAEDGIIFPMARLHFALHDKPVSNDQDILYQLWFRTAIYGRILPAIFLWK
jgi:hypothetical protein